jgi:AcrR family transcriptional regulator
VDKRHPASPPGTETGDKTNAAEAPASVGERILSTASDLFYREGVRAVGVQRIIDEAGIAKASLYAHYDSKDDLVAACLAKQVDVYRVQLAQRLADPTLDARARLLAMFDLRAEVVAGTNFRGCPILNTGSELADPHHPARAVAAEARKEVQELITQLCQEAGVTSPADVVGTLLVLYDGAAAAAQVDGNPAAGRHARWAAEQIIDAHLATPPHPPAPRPRRRRAGPRR